MHDSSRSPNVKGVPKPTTQKYDSSKVVRHIRFDRVSDDTLYQCLQILSSDDAVSIGIVVRRAITFYAERLLQHPEIWERERALARKGARIAKSSAAAAEEKKEVQS